MPQSNGIYYAESRGGRRLFPPVVLIHGAGSNHLVWPAEIRRLKGYRVLALDLPGHGKSQGVALHAVEDYTRAVEEFLSGLNIYSAILVGHSLGGAVALDLCLSHPDRVVGLGLISSGARLSMSVEILESLSNPATFALAYSLLEKRLFGSEVDEAVAEKTLAMLRSVRPGVLYGDWSACERFDRCEEVSRITCPAWVAVGTEDRLTPVYYSRYLVGQLASAELDLYHRAGHMLLLEKPQALARGLARFLSRIEVL